MCARLHNMQDGLLVLGPLRCQLHYYLLQCFLGLMTFTAALVDPKVSSRLRRGCLKQLPSPVVEQSSFNPNLHNNCCRKSMLVFNGI